ncbi:MAG: Flp pilus assembly protein CpaB [Bacilli bacterium]
MQKRRTSAILIGVAVVLATLTAVVVNGEVHAEMARLQNGNRLEPVVLATQRIAARTRITPGMVTIRDVPAGGRANTAVTSLNGAVGFIAKTTLYPDEQLLAPMVTTVAASPSLADRVPPGMVAMSVLYNPVTQAAGAIEVGDRVAVIAVLGKSYTASKYDAAKIIAANVQVLAVPTGTANGNGGGGLSSAGGNSRAEAVTLAVTPRQSSAIAFVTTYGSLNLVLQPSGQTSLATTGALVTDATVLRR